MAIVIKEFAESLADNTRYIDQDTIEYAVRNAKEAKKAGVESQMEKFARLAARESDAYLKLYYEYRMLLSPTAAENFAREFFQQARRQGVTSLDFELADGAEDSQLNYSTPYGNEYSDMGIFATVGRSKEAEPGRALELQDLLTKLINHPKLSRNGKIVLITRILTGGKAWGGKGLSISKAPGLDIKDIVTKVPPEYDVVLDQLVKLRRFGLTDDEVTTNTILRGYSKGDAKIPPLVSRDSIGKATKEGEDVMYELTGQTEIAGLKKFLLGMNESLNKMADHASSVLSAFEEGSAELRADTLMRVLKAVLRGGRVSTRNMIKAIVFAVAENMRLQTPLAKSRLFRGSAREVAKTFMQLSKSRNEEDIMMLQNLFLAPALKAAGGRIPIDPRGKKA